MDFAYPTNRLYNHKVEGKMPMRAQDPPPPA